MIKIVIVGCGMLTAAWMAGGPALAADHGSMEDQMACTPDVYKFCSSYVPDEDAIVSCLKRNMRVLSPACHQVFARPDTPAASKGNAGDQDTD